MSQEYTPSGSTIAYTIPAYADVVDADVLFKALVDDINVGVSAALVAAGTTDLSVKTASYTISLVDKETIIEYNSTSAGTFTLPLNSSAAIPVGSSIRFHCVGTGQLTVAGAGGVTVQSSNGLKSRAQYAVIVATKRATDTWIITGDTVV